MQIAKLHDVPFSHLSVDIIGELPPSSAKHRWILTIVCDATRYPHAIPLKKIDTKTVIDALNSFMLIFGYPDSISTDNGSQFVSEQMEEFFKMCQIKHIRCSAYHSMAQGVVERFNQSLGRCLRKLCQERINDWNLFVDPCLMAIRETQNSSTGFSPNELVFGRTLKGSMQIIKQLLTNEQLNPETKTTYQHVLDLREKIQDTCTLVKEELTKSQLRNKFYFDKRTKHRALKVGQECLLLLPMGNNKLEFHWKGPYKIAKAVGLYDYQIEMSDGKYKTFHINMLKEYHRRAIEVDPEIHMVAAINTVSSVLEEENGEDLMVQDDELLVHYNTIQKESYLDVEIDSSLSRDRQNEVKKLLKEFADIFSDVPHKTHLVEHEIKLTSNEIVQCKPYTVPFNLREKLDKEINSLLDAGIIEPSTGPFASPIVIVVKPDKSIRLCVNYKKLNQISQLDPEPMTLTEDIFDKLGGSKFYSKFDATKGFYAIPLTPLSQDISTFTCHRGLFKFKVLPFGLSTSPATYTRMMRKLLSGSENLDSYIDDVLCHTTDWQSHIQTLRDFFERVRSANISLKPSKCKIGGTSVDFLGHKVVEDMRTPNPKNLQKIFDVARPSTKKEIMSLLGLTGFYQSYIPCYSKITAPLTNLLRKSTPNKIPWGQEEENSFLLLTTSLLKQPILKLPEYGKSFTLRTDASDLGVACVLLQEHNGVLHPVCFASRKFSVREANYSISEREALAVVFGVQKFMKYLYGVPFILETDHKPLSILKTADSTSPRLQRWSLALQSYTFNVVYIHGKDCIGADFFSRHFTGKDKIFSPNVSDSSSIVLGGQM
jgi:hypothetical protein